MLRLVLSFLGGIFTMLTLSLVMAGVGTGAVFWMYGRDLPSIETLKQYTPQTISRVYSAEGQVIDEFATERRLFTPADEIPDLVKHAFVAAEDQNFYTHPGFDVQGIASAVMDAAVSGGRLRGASTMKLRIRRHDPLAVGKDAPRR